jgi:Rrf2 family protein
MAELAAAYPQRAPSVREIAQSQQVSVKYLEHIMQALKLAGLVRATRGTHGGYALARAPQEIKVADVFRALEGSPAPVPCVDAPETCPMARGCPTRDTWVELRDAIQRVLDGKTLQDLAEKCRASHAPTATT